MTAISVTPTAISSTLWDKAFNSLDVNTKAGLNAAKTHKRDILAAVLKEVEGKKQEALRKRWKFKTTGGEVIIMRDVLENIAGWVNKFKEAGDMVVQYDPVHASLPWAAVRFLLQTVVNDVELFGAMVNDLETISRLMAWSREFERQHLRGTKSDIEVLLEEALTRLYAEVLTHLAHMIRTFKKKDIARVMTSPFRLPNNDQMQKILAQVDQVLKIASLADTATLLRLEATVTRLSVHGNTSSRSLSEEKYVKMIGWLSASPYHNHHEFISQSRLPGAGHWLSTHPVFIEWHNMSSPSLLLLHGISGSGKTTLCSVLVDRLLTAATSNPSAAPLGYFYCTNPEFEKMRASPDDIMRTILGQLAQDLTERRKIRDFLWAEYERQSAKPRVDGLAPPKLRLRDCVRLILELAEQDPLTIVIDGLDSIGEEDRPELIGALREIVMKADNVVKIFATARTDSRLVSAADKSIQITATETREDMEMYVRHQVNTVVTDKLLLDGSVSLGLRSMLIQVLLDGAGEMFQWVKLQVQRLCREPTEDDVVAALQTKLPEDLDQLYANMLSRIFRTSATARDLAVKIFSWVLYMREPLTPPALLAALAVGNGSAILTISQLMNMCANMVVLDTACNVIRFAHQSVQEFLGRNESFNAAVAHKLLASACIQACSRGPGSADSIRIPSDDFYVYAAIHWPVHFKMAQRLGAGGDLDRSVSLFIFDDDFDLTLSYEIWAKNIQKLVPLLPRDHTMRAALDAIPNTDDGALFLASVFGLDGVLDVAFSNLKDLNTNQTNHLGNTPLYLAAALGHADIVKSLATKGAEVNVECGRCGSPLHAASFNGHVNVVDQLLKLGASTSCGMVFEDALEAAFRGDKDKVAIRLIDFIIKTEADYERALQGAAQVGFVEVVKQLEKSPFSIQSKTRPDKILRRTKRAIEGGDLGVLRQFLDEQGGDAVDCLPPDAVALATLHNHKDVVEFLLDKGMGVESEGIFGTPLITACLVNCEPVARLLLGRGCDINARGAMGDALQIAAAKGYTSIVKLLLDEGADPNQGGGYYGNALQAAAFHGHQAAVELLLSAGANVHGKGFSKDAFHAAAEGGHQGIIMLMLRKGYEFRHTPPGPGAAIAIPSRYKSLLRDSSPARRNITNWSSYWQSYTEPQDPLLDRGRPIPPLENVLKASERKFEDPNDIDEECPSIGYKLEESPYFENYSLEASAFYGHESTVKLLLEQREVLGIPDEEIYHATEVAARTGHLGVIQALLDDIATREPIDSYISSILEVGRETKQPRVVDFAVAQASTHPGTSRDEMILGSEMLDATEKYRNPETPKTIILDDFALACESGDAEIISAVLNSGHHTSVSSKELALGLNHCAIYGQQSIARILLESAHIIWNKSDYEEAFIIAACNGHLDFIKMLAGYVSESQSTSRIVIQHALTVSSENGHIKVVRHLLEKLSTGVNTLVLDLKVSWGLRRSPKLLFLRRKWDFLERAPLHSQGSETRAGDPDRDRGQTMQGDPKPVATGKTSQISYLQASLRGFSRFGTDDERRRVYPDIPSFRSFNPRKGSRPEHEEVLIALLDHGADPNDLGGQNQYPIQLAARYCPEHIIQRFIEAGAEVNATEEGESALHAATTRELSAASVLHKLLDAGAIIPASEGQSDALLDNTLRCFVGNKSTNAHDLTTARDDPDGRFIAAPSLEYVFKEGPGAVLFTLLSRMPQKRVEDTRYGLVLQMATVLNDEPFVELLLSRGLDVNATGYYYGTALQAAARFGHENLLQRLIHAGANVNIVAGRWHTALRAGLAGGNENIVQTLLDYGADANPILSKRRLNVGPLQVGKLQTSLQLAVKSGSLKIVQALIARGADASDASPDTVHPLIECAKRGSLEILRLLLDAGAPINIHGPHIHFCHNSDEASPIHAAATRGHLNIIEELLSRGVDLENKPEHKHQTPLQAAISKGQIESARLLLAAGASIEDGAALAEAVAGGHIEICQLLLKAGAKPENMLPHACREGHLGLVEQLLEDVYDGEDPEPVLDKVFAEEKLSGHVLRLLLDYAPVTVGRFIRVCATGPVASVEFMLDTGAVDVNGQDEKSGDYPLQVAASQLEADVVVFLLSRGANVHSQSAKHGTALMAALEASVAPLLRDLKSGRAKKRVARLSLIERLSAVVPRRNDDNHRLDIGQIPRCEKVVRALVSHGADTRDKSRALGPPLHLACLLGNKAVVELLLEHGADVNEKAGYFKFAIFAALQGGSPDIVSILLEKAPLCDYLHRDFATPLHLACFAGDGASVRKLLQHGAGLTMENANGETALTLALKLEAHHRFSDSSKETPLAVMLKLEKSIRVLDEDLVAASRLGGDSSSPLGTLLNLNKTTVVSEHVICRVLGDDMSRMTRRSGTISLLMQRCGSPCITEEMIKAARNHYRLKDLLKCGPLCKMTPEILQSLRDVESIKLVLERDAEVAVTEGVILRALELNKDRSRSYRSQKRRSENGVLELLLERKPQLAVTQDMLKAARCHQDLKILLKRLEPGTPVPDDVVAAVSKLPQGEAFRGMRILLKFDPTIRLSPKLALGMMGSHIGVAERIDALMMLLAHDPALPITPEMFLRVFGTRGEVFLHGRSSTRSKLARLMREHGKRVVFTEEVKAAFDQAFPHPDDVESAEQFYGLQAAEEVQIHAAAESEDSEEESQMTSGPPSPSPSPPLRLDDSDQGDQSGSSMEMDDDDTSDDDTEG